MNRLTTGAVGLIFVCAILLIGGCSSFGDVPVGFNGVEECASTLTGTVQPEGWHLKAPWCRFDNITIGNQQYKVDDATAVSKDQQQVKTSANITWTVNPARLVELQRKYHGDVADVILAPNVSQAVKQATAQYTATQLTTQRGDVQAAMESILRSRLAPYNNDLTVIQLSLTNYSFSDSWQKAIEDKVVAGQQLLTERTNLQIVQVKAQQAAAEAKGLAQAQNEQRQTLTAAILQKAWIDKWDGKLPSVVNGGQSLLNLGLPHD